CSQHGDGRIYRTKKKVESPRGHDVPNEVQQHCKDCGNEETLVREDVLAGLGRAVHDEDFREDVERNEWHSEAEEIPNYRDEGGLSQSRSVDDFSGFHGSLVMEVIARP